MSKYSPSSGGKNSAGALHLKVTSESGLHHATAAIQDQGEQRIACNREYTDLAGQQWLSRLLESQDDQRKNADVWAEFRQVEGISQKVRHGNANMKQKRAFVERYFNQGDQVSTSIVAESSADGAGAVIVPDPVPPPSDQAVDQVDQDPDPIEVTETIADTSIVDLNEANRFFRTLDPEHPHRVRLVEATDAECYSGAEAEKETQPPALATTKQPSKNATAHFLDAIAEPGQVIEIRAFDVDKYIRIQSGYFDDRAKLLQTVTDLEAKKPVGIFVTINPCNPALLARANNRMVKAKHECTTKDREIIRRVVLPIDIDAVRPSGISATDNEKAEALKVADAVKGFLTGKGWPAPIFVDSGNGYHLYFRVDLPNDEASNKIAKSILHNLADRFNTDGAKIDTTVYNASRIMRLPGTTARKGDPLSDRPHRMSRIKVGSAWI